MPCHDVTQVRLIRILALACCVISLSVEAAVDPAAARILDSLGANLTAARTAELALHLAVKTPTAPTGEGDLAAV